MLRDPDIGHFETEFALDIANLLKMRRGDFLEFSISTRKYVKT